MKMVIAGLGRRCQLSQNCQKILAHPGSREYIKLMPGHWMMKNDEHLP